MGVTRLIGLDDASVLATLATRNRTTMRPYEPRRDEDFFTPAGKRTRITDALDQHDRGYLLPYVILNEGEVVGTIALNEIIRGPLQSASVGYWVDEAHRGRGLATAALSEILAAAFGELGLHRVQAGTLIDNERSQRVLARCGFVRYGLAPSYLLIDGAWRDHVLFQVLAPT